MVHIVIKKIYVDSYDMSTEKKTHTMGKKREKRKEKKSSKEKMNWTMMGTINHI